MISSIVFIVLALILFFYVVSPFFGDFREISSSQVKKAYYLDEEFKDSKIFDTGEKDGKIN